MAAVRIVRDVDLHEGGRICFVRRTAFHCAPR